MNREDVSTQVPGVGFQVAGRSVRSVSPEQTPLLNRKMAGGEEGGKKKKKKKKKIPNQYQTRLARASPAVHLSALSSAEPSQEMGGILREAA